MTTVADIVINDPSAAKVFERHGIDYCCRGRRSFDDACTEAGIDSAVVRAEIDALDRSPTAPVPDDVGGLIGYIVATHHAYLRRELPRLAELMDKVVAAHGDVHPELASIANTLRAISSDLLPHMMKEEKVLFPLAIELLGAVEPPQFHCGSVTNPIGAMHREHDQVGELLGTLRHQTNGYAPPADACPTWHACYRGLADLEADTHLHVHLENNRLFPEIAALESRLVASGSGQR